MLFIASGAFHNKSPSDLLPELQGRFPVRVALQPLNKEDLIQILGAKKFNLLEQTKQLLATEGVELEFTACGVEVRRAYGGRVGLGVCLLVYMCMSLYRKRSVLLHFLVRASILISLNFNPHPSSFPLHSFSHSLILF